jgi:hypothetical protein
MNTFDFEKNKFEILNLQTLELTHKENDIYGHPLRGVYHYEVINRIADICKSAGLNYEIEEIFAAQNKSKQNPGVIKLPQVEDIHGINSVEAHILKRVYSTIKIKDGQTSDITTTIAIAYHQEGIQIGFGPNVVICRNQCILNRERLTQNYGSEKVTNDEMFAAVENWMQNFAGYREQDIRILQKMKEIFCSQNEVFQIIGLLTSLRVAHDTSEQSIRMNDTYPLNQSQISQFTESYLLKAQETKRLTLWDVYNLATDLYHPDKTEIPNLLPQNLSLMEVLTDRYNLN